MKLKGKKLLIMGGPALACDIVKKARLLGIYTIVTDWYPESLSPAKKIADESFMISTSDVDAVVSLIRQEKIDGVITGFTDSTLQYYQKVCEKAELPCYATAEQIGISTDKRKFKNMCKKYNVPVVEEYCIDDIFDSNQLKRIKFPVVIKPVDNSGARGISICNNRQEFIRAYEKALSFSESKSVIVERYMRAKEATIFYVFRDGAIFLMGIGDRHTKNNQEGFISLPVAYIFPSRYLNNYLEEQNSKVIEMFNSLKMKNGMVFIQSFIEDEKYIFYEMGFRLTGSLEYKIMEPLIGINHLELMIEFSITGKMGETDLFKNLNPKYSSYGCNITLLARPGQIGKIEGIKTLFSFPEVIDVFPSYKEGDVIPDIAKGTLQQVVLRVFAVTRTKAELIKVIEKIHDVIRVTSISGENMLLDKLNTEDFRYE